MKYTEALSELVKLEVVYANEVLKKNADQLRAVVPAAEWELQGLNNYNYWTGAFLLAHLYKLDHPDNPLNGEEWLADLAVNLTDKWSQWYQLLKKSGQGVYSVEWPPLITGQVLDLLGDRVSDAQRASWMEYMEAWIELASTRPYGFTSPNHEGWRQVGMYRLGRFFDRPEWCDLSHYMCLQELNYQTAEGFWEESPLNGPSMRYNHLMLAPLAWMYRLTEDEKIGEACGRLANFMATYTFPDGITVGAFDGRQSTSPAWFAPVCPGMELEAEGRTLNSRGIKLWKEMLVHGGVRLIGSSAWYTFFQNYFVADAVDYYGNALPEAEQREAFSEDIPLKVDVPGVCENHTRTFEGIMQRKGKWVLALSGQYAIKALRNPSLYNLGRQSRISLWHENARLVLGGGHERFDFVFPYANAILDTGWAGDTDFGLVGQNKDDRKRSYYVPHWSETWMKDTVAHLKTVFGHGTVEWTVDLQDDETAVIKAAWDIRRVKRLVLQVPLIVSDGAVLTIDGTEKAGLEFVRLDAEKEVAVSGGLFKSDVKVKIPANVPCKVNYPLDILRTYLDLFDKEEFEPPFRMAFICCQWTDPADTGEAEFSIKIGK
ncbi:hypothetical protein ACFL4W_02155 [Planctomycetota bacterium]